MKINLFSGFLLAILFLTFTAGSLMAGSTLYDNGPYGGDIDAWTINEGFVVSDFLYSHHQRDDYGLRVQRLVACRRCADLCRSLNHVK
jgi:hypothetical protein